MNSIPLVSVGLFVYNGERFIEEALRSILNQTFTDFELIISDNASTDRTGEIAQAYARRDNRIRYYRSEKNMGAGWNARRVYELATGKYSKWAAVDELLEWWDPARTRDLTFPEFRQLLEYFLSIYRAPLGAGQKLQITLKKEPTRRRAGSPRC